MSSAERLGVHEDRVVRAEACTLGEYDPMLYLATDRLIWSQGYWNLDLIGVDGFTGGDPILSCLSGVFKVEKPERWTWLA